MWFWVIFVTVIGTAECVRRFAFGGQCLLMDIFNFPCPTCGMTRATLFAMMLRFDISIKYNPAFWTAPVSGICLIMSIFDKKHPKLWITLFFVTITILFIFWIVLRVIMRVPIPTDIKL